MKRLILAVCVVGSALASPAVGAAQDEYKGKDLKWQNSAEVKVVGNGILVTDNARDGGDVGFDMPAKYAGKRVKITFEVKSDGPVRVGIDRFDFGLIERTEWWVMDRQEALTLECTVPANVKDLKVVVRQDVGTTMFIAFGKIELK